MLIDECLKNIRCDTANCHKPASFNINTSGHKGNIYLCNDCFNSLYINMQKIKKTNTLKKKTD